MSQPPHIDDAIAAREAKIAKMRHELDIEEAELRGLKLARDMDLRAAASRSPLIMRQPQSQGLRSAVIATIDQQKRGGDRPASGYRGGRQPGAISQPWRRILSELYWRNAGLFEHPGQAFPIGVVIDAAARQGIKLRPSEAESRLQHYQQFNYVSESDSAGRYAITPTAADKFGFLEEPLKNEAPNAEASGPHESLGPGDQTGAV